MQLHSNALKTRIPWDMPLVPKNDWGWLTFDQHHGLFCVCPLS
jgi:hypothetical protein